MWLYEIIIFVLILAGVKDILQGNQSVLACEDHVLGLLSSVRHVELGSLPVVCEHMVEIDFLLLLVRLH